MHITHYCGFTFRNAARICHLDGNTAMVGAQPADLTPRKGAALEHENAAEWGLPLAPQSGVVLAWGNSWPSPEVHLCSASLCGKHCSWLSHCNTLDRALQPPLEYLEVFQNGSFQLLQLFNK